MLTLRYAAICVTAVLAAPAIAQNAPPNDSEKEMVGAWELSNAERDRACAVTFSTDKGGGGFKVEFEAKCADLFPPVKDVTGWKYPDSDLLRLTDGKGKSVIEFSEVEDSIFEAPTPGLGVVFLQKPGAAGPPPKPPEDFAGDWVITRGGKTLCTLTFTTTPGEDGLTLSAKPGCDAAIVRLGFNQWRIDRDELMLMQARGNPWRFESVDDKTWQRVPDAPNPYRLVRQ
ncbi:MAG: AprI/Inh family metalloprotease inhibitor [Pseudolabrys sp.]|nr:AprI/Inh family metalloprotease inhibitor [Pseudolabrys sp.]MBV9260065.1 AprI/Inh family metalloprotease inhibitor [Pseudolabrys sp.]